MLDRHPLDWTRDWLLLVVLASVAAATTVCLRRRTLPLRALAVVDAAGHRLPGPAPAPPAADRGLIPILAA
ncbi:hypothetical protein CP980_04045 [Streptomyces vinaceus]|uniref:Uncharacterized protein n=1 Tax=Streptomyces vinaceus TaxID=1960 RepID=A0A5J6J3Z0_STRVI|nr:hypothetical protein CP980_04045 [Streptomyces vinaceus]